MTEFIASARSPLTDAIDLEQKIQMAFEKRMEIGPPEDIERRARRIRLSSKKTGHEIMPGSEEDQLIDKGTFEAHLLGIGRVLSFLETYPLNKNTILRLKAYASGHLACARQLAAQPLDPPFDLTKGRIQRTVRWKMKECRF